MGTGFTRDVQVTVKMEVRLFGDYAEPPYPTADELAALVGRLLKISLSTPTAKLMQVEIETRED
jgi:hypothetical protein